jgi:hypothetical protein
MRRDLRPSAARLGKTACITPLQRGCRCPALLVKLSSMFLSGSVQRLASMAQLVNDYLDWCSEPDTRTLSHKPYV